VRPRIASIENLICQDPGGRNIFALQRRDHLRLAALSLKSARRVLIVSGFYIPQAGAGETDGPPGVQALGEALAALGIPVGYATDTRNLPLFEALGLAPLFGYSPHLLREWEPTHLVAIERVGRARDGRYYNMRGEALDPRGEPLDEWFIEAERRGIVTIGIGDGGNEIGMGRVFREVVGAIAHGPRIASVVLTDYVIVAGSSNWGAYGLVAALSLATGRPLLPSSERAAQAVRSLVQAGAVDGVTLRREEAVDGLPLEHSLAVLEQIRLQIAPSPLEAGHPLTVGVLGLGQTGLAAARLARKHGHGLRLSDRARVALPADLAEAPHELGGHSMDFLASCDLIVTSPGLATRSPLIAALRRKGMAVMSELELACQLERPRLLAITGSAGKSGTVRRLAALFASGGRPIRSGGNKGAPLSALLAEAPPSPGPVAVAVSSFQLESVVHFRPALAALLNFLPHHIERHGTLAEFLRIESRVFMNQEGDDILILNGDDPALAALADKSLARTFLVSARGPVRQGAWMEAGRIWARAEGEPVALGRAGADFPENALTAALAAWLEGLPAATIALGLES
jgi:hypothetical protein